MTQNRRVVLAGGSGFLGLALADALAANGWQPLILSRSRPTGERDWQEWDGRKRGDWEACLEGAAALVNLCGSRIDVRLTEANRLLLRSSRLQPTALLGKALADCSSPPRSWLQASAIGYYGDPGATRVTEDSEPGGNFYARLCQDWEETFRRARPEGIRGITLRIAVVLGKEDGALPRLSAITRAFLGGTLGSGRQGMSWISVDDLCDMACRLLEGEAEGVYNASSPQPLANREFMRELRRHFGRPWIPPAPPFALRLMAPLLGLEADLLLGGSFVEPARWLREGGRFRHEALASCLQEYYPKR